MKTVILLTAALEGFFVLTTALLAVKLKKIRGPFWWFLSTFFAFTGLILLISPSPLPAVPLFFLYMGNLFIIAAMALVCIGMDQFSGGTGHHFPFLILGLVFACIYLVVCTSYPLRILIFSLAATVFYGTCAGVLVKARRTSPFQKSVGVFFAVTGALYFLRLVQTLVAPPTNGLSSLAQDQIYYHFTNFTLILFVGSSFLVLVAFRFQEELQLINKKLEQKDKEKVRFLGILSHDLRGPISGMARLLDVLCEDKNKPVPHETLVTLGDTANQSYKLLEDILLWAKAQNHEMTPVIVPFPVEELGLATWKIFQAQALEKGIHFQSSVDKNLLVRCDVGMSSTILRNFFSNAVKFSLPSGLIRLSSSLEEGWVRVQVSDSGTGMSAEKLATLFQIDKIHSSPGTQGELGSGLGLIFCQELAERQGARIEVESRPGQGTTMTLLLPLATKSV